MTSFGLIATTDTLKTPIFSYITSDYTTTSTTVAQVTGMSLSLTLAIRYYFEIVLFINTKIGTPGATIGMDGSCTLTDFDSYIDGYQNTSTISVQYNSRITAFNSTVSNTTTTGTTDRDLVVTLKGTITPATSGTFYPEIGQRAASADPVTVRSYSFMWAVERP